MFPLGQMPSFEFTEEMRRQALKDAIRQAGLGMMGAALGGARSSEAFGQGLLGGAKSYQQAPMLAQKQWKSQLDAQNDWLNANKSMLEVQKMTREQKDAEAQKNLMASLLGSADRGNLIQQGAGPRSPEDLDMIGSQQIANTLNNPRFAATYASAGGNVGQVKELAGMYQPRKLDTNAFYENPITRQREYIPKLPDGMTYGPNGQVMNAEGFTNALFNQEQAKGMAGVLPDQLRQAFALNNAPVTDVLNGRATRAGVDNPVIGLPAGMNAQQSEARSNVPTFNASSDTQAQELARVLEKTGQPFSVKFQPPRSQQGAQRGTQVALTPEQKIAFEAQGVEERSIAEGRAKRANEAIEKIGAARQTVQQIDYALRNMPRTGQFAPEAATLVGVLDYIGIATPEQRKALENMGTFSQVSTDGLLRKLQALKPVSNDEMKTVMQRMGLERATPKVAQMTLALTRATANLEAEKGDFLRNYAEENNTFRGAEKAWSESKGSIVSLLFTDPAMQEFNPRRMARGRDGKEIELQELPNGYLFDPTTGQLFDPKKKAR